MQKHLIWLHRGASQLKGWRDTKRYSGRVTQKTEPGPSHGPRKGEFEHLPATSSANPCHKLEEHHNWAQPSAAWQMPPAPSSLSDEDAAALALDSRDLAVTGIHTNALRSFLNTIQKPPSPGSWEPFDFQATMKHSQAVHFLSVWQHGC